MKRLITLILCLSSFAAFAHSRADYESAMLKFRSFYNSNNVQGIRSLFSDSWGKSKQTLWTKERLRQMKSGYGELISCSYVTIDTVSDNNRLVLFKTVFEKRTFMTGLDLDKTKKIGTFQLNASSPFIRSLLQEP